MTKRSGSSAVPVLLAKAGALALVAGALSGCLGSPTYGTGKRADVQLLEDVTSVVSIGSKEKEPIEYKPRPTLVTTAPKDTLPPPQDDIRTASNEAWPESPEERRARVRAYADANSDDLDYKPIVTGGGTPGAGLRTVGRMSDDVAYMPPGGRDAAESAQRAEFKRRLEETQQGSPTQRRFLSEPPLEYRVPAETAAADDLGEDEWRKEKERKAAARKKSGGKSLGDWLPGF